MSTKKVTVKITGPNGSGKSLMLSLLANIMQVPGIKPEDADEHTVEFLVDDAARNRIVDIIEEMETRALYNMDEE